MGSKDTYEKHAKYLEFYKIQESHPDTEYWGIGIENETYLMFDDLFECKKDFIQNNQVPERYSVNYWKNYKPDPLKAALMKLPAAIPVPIYINSYIFRNADLLGEHKSVYTKKVKQNPLYSGETIDGYLRRVSTTFTKLFERYMIYDGDTFEITTFHFYKTTVPKVVEELSTIKREFVNELNKNLVSKFTIFKKKIIYPKYNYGFTRFLSNLDNIAVCNNGTYHINLTLPTNLCSDGAIRDPEKFKNVHANAIRAIQWIEPFLVALYGTPDILHALDPAYVAGSQRLGMSRYIGLGTYASQTMQKGKLLDTFVYMGKENYMTELHSANSPYVPPATIGFDFNYNKFKKHGIELRILDYFPEEHLEHIINLLLLVCEHSLYNEIPDPRENKVWSHQCMKAIKKGSTMMITPPMYLKLYSVFGYTLITWLPFRLNDRPLNVLKTLSGYLYRKYRMWPLCTKMSPNMKPIQLVDYNRIMRLEFKKTIGK